MPNCAHCRYYHADLRCEACTKLRPAQCVPAYCSASCQRADWERHRPYCKTGQYFDRVKKLDPASSKTDTDNVINIGRSMSAPDTVLRLMSDYLTHVQQPVRELNMRFDTRLKPEVCAAIRHLRENTTPKEYVASSHKRVSDAIRGMSKTGQRMRVAFENRRWWDIGQDSYRGDTNKVKGMELYANDFAVLDLESFEKMYGGKRLHYLESCSCTNPEAITAMLFFYGNTQILP